jgi:hypothetical protein
MYKSSRRVRLSRCQNDNKLAFLRPAVGKNATGNHRRHLTGLDELLDSLESRVAHDSETMQIKIEERAR